jgi:hypothetical protein
MSSSRSHFACFIRGFITARANDFMFSGPRATLQALAATVSKLHICSGICTVGVAAP